MNLRTTIAVLLFCFSLTACAAGALFEAGSQVRQAEALLKQANAARDQNQRDAERLAADAEHLERLTSKAKQPSNFAIALRQRIETTEAGHESRRLLAILDAPDSRHRDRQLHRMERHARVHLDLADGAQIDWQSIDWAKVFDVLVKVLIALLPFLLAL